ncbi:caspase-23 isoform X1 [Triplophysa dalaica]|uniref:caspase-23 isoform X1 n=2 Tax=Triplophysa dalaica TaxID=1582913 RepID=UPI0024DF692C|nr:caspase-23 isoform X1 [Triplophysa dalaica]
MTEEADQLEDSVKTLLGQSLIFNPKKSYCSSEVFPPAGRGVLVNLPCGHQMTSDYVVAWFKYYLKQKETEFTCPRFHEGRGKAKLSYQAICQWIPLTPKQKEFWEENLSILAARRLCDFKACPGCQSWVERRDQRNLCVHCTLCTANMKRTFFFCWKCEGEWKGPVNYAVECGNNGCGQKVEAPDPLVKCKSEFKQEMLKKEGDDIYPTKDKSPGRKRLALLVNNVEFEYIDDRIGADKDEQSMERLLTALGYTVVTLTNLTAQGMTAAMQDFAQREEHLQSDSCFVVFMSHGNATGICGVSTQEKKEDIFLTDEIFKCLNTPNCAGLRDKPKIILIQACRGAMEGSVDVPDSVPINNRGREHREKDFCCLRSSTPETLSYRNKEKGSNFIQDVVKIFHQHAHQDHIEELFRKVLKEFKENHRDQMPCKERTTLSKKFYLFPGL